MAYFLNNISTIFKSLFYQGGWNTENMQGTGFAWLVRNLAKSRKIELKSADSKALSGYFNTNPSFVTFVVGIFLKEYPNGTAFPMKNIYSTAFAALGDSFFWHSLRPFCFFISALLFLINPIFAIIAYPLLFMLVHLTMLVFGLFVGERLGKDCMMIFQRLRFNQWADYVDTASMFLQGILIIWIIKKHLLPYLIEAKYDHYILIASIGSFLAMLFGYLLYRYIKMSLFFWAMILLGVLLLGGTFGAAYYVG